MALVYKAAADFHWFGHAYAGGDVIDVTGLDQHGLRLLVTHCPVSVTDVGAELDPVAAPEVAAETTRATAAESANATAITTEANRAANAEGLKATAVALTAETARATGAESTNATAISTEATRAAAAEALRGVVVVHGSTASTARPSGAVQVHWIGSVAPTNAATNDEWTDTTNKLTKRWNASAFETIGSGTSSLTPTAIKTAAYTAAVSDLAMMNVPGGATALTLPTAPADKSQVGYRAIGATAAVPLTVTAGGSDTIGLSGATSTTIALADETVELQYDAANTRWISIGNVKTQTSLDGRYPQFTLGALRTVRDLRLRLQDTRLAGGNIVPRPADVALQGTSHNPYDFLFQGVIANDGSAWPWITAQIDAIASSTTRGNAVRMMGATGWIQYGSYTLAQCLAVWDKIAAYCQQKGLLLYASLSGGWTEYGGGTSQFPDATGLANIVAVAQHLDTYGCVLALDIVQEFELSMPSGASFTTTQTQIISIMNSIRAAGVSLPLTSSNSLNNSTMWAGNFAPDVQAANFDFIDRHVYYSSGTPSHADVAKMLVVMANSNVPVIIGEAGLSQASTQANITAYYNAIGGLLKGSRVLGAFAWAIADQSATAGNEWGMYSGAPGSTLTARTYMTTPFSSWLRRSRPSACLTHNGTNNTNISLSTTTTIPTGTFQIDHGGFANTAAGKVCTIPYGLDGIYLIQLQVQLLTSGNASPFSWNAWVSDTADGTATRWVNMNEQSPINVNDTRVASAIVELGGGQDIYASIFSAAATVLVGSANANGHPKGTFVSLTRIGPL